MWKEEWAAEEGADVELPAVWWQGGGGAMLSGAAPGSKECSDPGLLVFCAASLVGIESVPTATAAAASAAAAAVSVAK